MLFLGDDALIIEEVPLDEPAHDGVAVGGEHHIAAVGVDFYRVVRSAENFQQLLQRLGGNDDADIPGAGHVPLDDGQPVAVQRHDGQAARLNDEQLAGVGGLFVLGGHRIDGLFDHLPHHGAGNGHGVLGAGVGQRRIIRRHHGGNLKLRHAAADFCLPLVGQLDAHIAAGHPAHHGTQQSGVQHRLAGNEHVALDGGGDAHFHVIAGERQLKPLGLQIDALQHRDGSPVGDGSAHTLDGRGQQGFLTFKSHGVLLFNKNRGKAGGFPSCFSEKSLFY